MRTSTGTRRSTLLPIHIRTDDIELRLFSTIMTLGTPQDITLQELRVETFFPADSASEATWMQLVGDLNPGRSSVQQRSATRAPLTTQT